MEQHELEQIKRAVFDSDAFEEVFTIYRPIVLARLRHYGLRGMAYDDWMQEARIAMLRAAKRYDGSGGSQFGSYYKMVLISHFTSILRGALAQKRAPYNTAILFGASSSEIDNFYSLSQPEGNVERIADVRLEWSDYYNRLSDLEVHALAKLLRNNQNASAREKRAINRARNKFRDFLSPERD
ncbi:sigma factor [Lacticaseibacillus zhaodongensis]|uniref:sigma factor n=1 Tax=Lacticaseibacillus zhaodongensis TaxID=2668065 RepID=UPI0012D36483|nr:sigma factor [Lacticaseibacillus zhaodongensis]